MATGTNRAESATTAPDRRYRWSDLQELIFLDRYARKGARADITVGDTVVVLTKEHPRYPQKEVGVVEAVDGDDISIRLRSGELFTQQRPKVDRPLEVGPEDMWDRMARAIVQVEDGRKRKRLEQEFRWLLQDWRFVAGGRINAMLGTGQDLTAYNCYVIPMRPDDPSHGNDSRRAIMDTLRNMVEIMSRGGGVGINLSTLRPRLAYVQGVNGKSSGSVSWGELFSTATGLVEQGGSRRGALMLILNIWHPDVIEFINAKRDFGVITNANISVGLTDDFERALDNDEDWELVFPDYEAVGSELFDREWDGNIQRWKEQGYPVKVHKTIPARELWRMIVESAWASAEPGIVRMDYANRMSNTWYFHDLIATNPCVTGDTLISTENGLERAEDLYFANKPQKVVVDGRMSEEPLLPASAVFATGIKPVYKLTTREGFSVRLTADHRVMTERGWVVAEDLQPGDEIHVVNRPGAFGAEGSRELGLTLGWLVGDGTITSKRAVLSFWGDDRELAPALAEAVQTVVRPSRNNREYALAATAVKGRDEARIQSTRLRELCEEHGLTENRHMVPDVVFRGTRDMQRAFLQSLFSADGHIEADQGKRSYSVRLTSHSYELLQDVQRLLLNFGVYSRIYAERRRPGERLLPDGYGGLKSYETSGEHQLVISRTSLVRFADDIGFLQDTKNAALQSVIDSYERGPYADRFVATFVELVPDGEEMVYDLTQPATSSFVANGLVVHNCGEQFLPAWGVCNLGHINLSRFVENGEVLWDDLKRAARLGVRFLDNIIDITPYFFEQNEQVQKAERRVGMGTMGLAEMLIKLGLRYGSPESLEMIDKVYRTIAMEAYYSSVDIAEEKGSFPMFDAEKFLQSGFMQSMPEEVREAVRTKGIRNCTILTQAPTGTTGTMVGTSTGIEPYYQWSYWRMGRLGRREVREAIVDEWLAENPDVDGVDNLPDFFVTALDLDPADHVRVQAAIQRWVDSSISKTTNCPSDWTVEQVEELYALARELGCKGVTIYRDQSRDEQVLSRKEDGGDSAQAAAGSGTTTAAATEAAPAAAAGEATGASGVAASPQSTGTNGNGIAAMRDAKPTIGEVPEAVQGVTFRQRTMVGTARITINEADGEPFETIIVLGKGGMDITADSEAIGRLISLYLRTPSPISNTKKLGLVVEQLSGIGGAQPFGFGPHKVLSLPDALAKALERYLHAKDEAARGEAATSEVAPGNPSPDGGATTAAGVADGAGNPGSPTGSNAGWTSGTNGDPSHDPDFDPEMQVHPLQTSADLCPACGTFSFIKAEGCGYCRTCGHSTC